MLNCSSSHPQRGDLTPWGFSSYVDATILPTLWGQLSNPERPISPESGFPLKACSYGTPPAPTSSPGFPCLLTKMTVLTVIAFTFSARLPFHCLAKTSLVYARCGLGRLPSTFPALNRDGSSSRKTSLLGALPFLSLPLRLQSPSLLTGIC